MTFNRTSPAKKGLKPAAYGAFGGLDTSRDLTNMDSRERLPLTTLDNGFVDWRGQIVRDPGVRLVSPGSRVRHIRFFSPLDFAWVEEDESSRLSFATTRGHKLLEAYPSSAITTSLIFDRNLYFLAEGETPYFYNGSIWQPATAADQFKPAFGCSVSRRMVISGMRNEPTRIELSRVDNEQFSPQEEAASVNPLRAGFIDVKNLFSTAESIVALANFEQDRLVIFTEDRTILYRIDPDISNWGLDERANIKIGCVSHNTVVQAGTDLLFCSRSGVHNVQRSPENGLLVYSRSLSDEIDILYRSYLRSVPDPRQISAVFDQDEARYRIFFPSPSGAFTRVLSVATNPEGGEPRPAWSTMSFLNASCGDSLAGRVVLGGRDGVYEITKIEDPNSTSPELTVETPMLWHGSYFDRKDSHSLVIQASGSGTIAITAEDDTGRVFFDKTIEVEGDDNDDFFQNVPLSQEYDIPFQFQYRGLRLRFVCKGNGLFRIHGCAILYRNQ